MLKARAQRKDGRGDAVIIGIEPLEIERLAQ